MLLSEMFGVERDVEFCVEGYEKTLLFKISLNYNGAERLMSKYSDKDKWHVALPDTIFTIISIAPSGIIHLPPPLTDEQREQLKALYTLGFKWLAKQRKGYVMFFQKKPHKNAIWFSDTGDEQEDYGVVLPNDTHLSSLVSWSDPEPLDIVQTLRDAGVEVE